MLEEKIYQDYLAALKAKDKHKTQFLSFIRAELKNQAIELKKKNLEDQEVLVSLKKLQKRLLDAKESIAVSGRTELMQNAEEELRILNEYLPPVMNDDELTKLIDEAVLKTNASSLKDMGKVMKEVLAVAKARIDPQKASSLVKEKLSRL